jgi:hypothetical protein
MVQVIKNRGPAPVLLVFLAQHLHQFIEPGGFHFIDIVFEVARGNVSRNEAHANHDHEAVQQERQEYFMSEFKLHAIAPGLTTP